MFDIKDFPSAFSESQNAALLSGILRGIEREALRTTQTGALSHKAHPQGLGSALTHPQITTDFSESLLEFITPPTHRVEDLFSHLEAIHKFAQSQLDNELLWCSSMPCNLQGDDNIPVALYGNSNNGKMKTIYRIGLGHRYGRAMQTVSGVHYNFSLPNAFWALLQQKDNNIQDLQTYKNTKYFDLIRNFRRHYWLLIYLFGASPALCESFVANQHHGLSTLPDGHTLYLPYATSLRMGDLGYQSKTQESLFVCYNELPSYMRTLCRAITKPHTSYEDIGLKDIHGNYKQLNTSILQIENEFYSSIRPKRTAHPGETALAALQNRGVEYIEVRCLDVNPFEPYGISKEHVRFLDTFLLYCALADSPATSESEAALILRNQKTVVTKGREPNLILQHQQHGDITLKDWANHLIDAMQDVANLLDKAKDTHEHSDSLYNQSQKVVNSELTPSAQILRQLKDTNYSYPAFGLKQSQQHSTTFKAPLSEELQQRMEEIAIESLQEQIALEQGSIQPFEEFIQNYYKQYSDCRCTNS